MSRRRITLGQCCMIVATALAAVRGGAATQPLRARCPPAAGDNCTQTSFTSNSETFYLVNGVRMRISFNDGDYFQLSCNGGELDEAALPRFDRDVTVQRVTLQECPPPAAAYARLLAALNVSAPRELLLQYVPARPQFRAAHFRGLALRRLEADARAAAPQRLDEEALAALEAAGAPARLVLRDVRLARLPRGVRRLRVARGGLTALPADALPALEALHLEEPALRDARNLSAAPRLRDLTLVAPVEWPPAPPLLARLELWRWRGERPPPWAGCGRLRALALASAALRRPPPAWLAACAQLAALSLTDVSLRDELPPRLLQGLAALERLEMRFCEIERLPEDFFSYTVDLAVVDLSNNLLTSLPRRVSSLRRLRELRLRGNRLGGGALPALAPLHALEALDLASNPLGDLCGRAAAAAAAAHDDDDTEIVVSENSPLAELRALATLRLSRVNATRVCADWRRLPALHDLDLSHNRITTLQYDDLHMIRRGTTRPAVVNLYFNPVETILYDEQQYERAVAGPVDKYARVQLNSALRCDCALYQFARALAARPAHVDAGALRCEGGRALRALPLRELACALPAAACWRGCACTLRPARGGVQAARARAAAARAVAAQRVAGAPAARGAAAARAARARPARQPAGRGAARRRARAVRAAAAAAAARREPAALRLRTPRPRRRAAGERGPGGRAERDAVRGRQPAVARGVRAGRRAAGRAGAAGGGGGGGGAGGAAGAARAAAAAEGVPVRARAALALAGGGRRRRRPAVRRVRVVLAPRRAVRGGGAGRAAGGGPAAVPAVPALPRLGGGRVDPGADRGVGAALAAHAGRAVAALRGVALGARRVPRGARGGAARRAAAAAGRAAGRAAAGPGARAARLPLVHHLRALGRPLVLGEAALRDAAPPARRAAAPAASAPSAAAAAPSAAASASAPSAAPATSSGGPGGSVTLVRDAQQLVLE